jgi:hypothetical protein
LPNIGPYIYDVKISGLTRSSIYIYIYIKRGAKRTHVFQTIVTLFIFNIKKMSTPKQPVISPVLITYIYYSITEYYIEKMAQHVSPRVGDVPWPPRSPAFSASYFVLGGYLKSKVYV